MAGSETQKQLLTLIRDYTTEKSQGDRRVVNQKRQIEALVSEIEAVNTELEEGKRAKEAAEQELKGYEVELYMHEASIQTLEARIALISNEISKVGSELTDLKNEENSLRDGFLEQMLELNAQIRKFHELIADASNVENCSKATSSCDPQQTRVDLENELVEIMSQADEEEQRYKAEKEINAQIQQELGDLEERALLLDSVMKENMELQDLTRQTSELETYCAALGNELQQRLICPSCHKDNSEELGNILQTSD